MKTIYKYELNINDTQEVEMPEGAEIPTAQMQYNKLCLWALVSPEKPKKPRAIDIIGTGNPADDVARKFISTVQVQVPGGNLVWHIFERLP